MAARLMGYVSASNTPTIVGAFPYGVATGGTSSSITVGGQAYTLLTFTSTGTLTVSSSGLFDYLIFSGGGGALNAPGNNNRGGGAGGAGSFATGTIYLSANQTITIGAGGAGNSVSYGSRGSATALGLFAAIMGGGGCSGSTDGNQIANGNAGACGAGGNGGATGGVTDHIGGLTLLTSDFGKSGGDGIRNGPGGGGGGITGAGGNAVSSTGGAGGAGYDVSTFIGSGSALYKGGGGGGGGVTGGAGGSSVGGNGGSNTNGTSASANTASGGGGAGSSAILTGGAGGSGIAYIRFKV